MSDKNASLIVGDSIFNIHYDIARYLESQGKLRKCQTLTDDNSETFWHVMKGAPIKEIAFVIRAAQTNLVRIK